MVTNEHLQSIIDGEIGVIDSTQAVAVAKELLAAREYLKAWEFGSEYERSIALAEWRALRKAAE